MWARESFFLRYGQMIDPFTGEDQELTQQMCGKVVVGDENISLQDSFKKFRERKIRERQILKLCNGGLGCSQGRTSDFKEQLRMKFIDRAKSYLGVPYAERYKSENDPVAPLYLDCCGLVRQVLWDLQSDFGFLIGRWNQAYQIDTLPIVLDRADLKPGDLIFYEGQYYSSKAKSQKHNMVHVEIFLGGESGSATIGARYQRGVVSIFPSFEFTSTTWELVRYHFRSIDTWLDGECKSHCLEHAWVSEAWQAAVASGKRSIFHDDANEEDCSAGGDDEVSSDSPNPASCDITAEDSIENNASVEKLEFSKSSGSIPLQPSSIQDSTTDDNIDVSNPNSSATGSQRPKRNSSLRNSLTSMDFDSSKQPDKSKNLRRDVSTSLDALPAKKNANPHTYYVCKSNGWKLVKDSLDKRGWQQLPFEYNFSSRFSLKWVERRSQIDYKSHQPGQLVCHIPNNELITSKLGLYNTLRDYFGQSRSLDSNAFFEVPWVPQTFRLDSPADIQQLVNEDEQYRQENHTNSLWIYKPSCNNRGRGIRVFQGKEALEEICFGKNTGDPQTSIPPSKGIVQKYLMNPLLIGPEKLKFDIRCYFLIARNFPTILAFYCPGYCRLTLKSFSTDISSLEDPTIHLTNAAIQKKDPLYKENKEKQIQLPARIADLLDEEGRHSNADFIRNDLDHQIMLCMTDIIQASGPKFLRKHGYFDLLGCDFMLTDDNQLVLIEVNTNPALSLDNSTLENLLPGVVDGAIDIILQCQGPDRPSRRKDDTALLQNLPQNFRLLYDERTGFIYGK